MYNNVGRSTARGTGTNGYIQRNLARLDPTRQRTIAALQKPLKQKSFNARKPNKAILERQTERAIESKVYDLQCSLEDKGNNAAQIKMKCSELREELRRKVAMGESLGEEKNKDSHMIAALQHEKNEIFRRALNISKEHKRGQGFDQTLQEEKKEQRVQDRLADTEKTVEEQLEELDRHPLARKPKRENDEEEGEERRGRGGRNDGGGWGGDRDRGARWVKDRNRSSRNWNRRDERRGGDRDRDRDRGRRGDRRRDSDRRRRGERRGDAERKQRTRKRGEKRTLESPSPPRKRLKRTEDKRRQTRSPSNSAEAMPDDGGRWTGVTERKRLSISGERDDEHNGKSKKKEKKKRKFKLRNSKSDKHDDDRKRRDPSFDKNLEEHLREQETSKSFKPKLQVVDSAPNPESSDSMNKTKKKKSGQPAKKKSRKKKKKKVETPPSSDDSDSDSDSSSSSS